MAISCVLSWSGGWASPYARESPPYSGDSYGRPVRARTFQDSLEAGYKKDHPTTPGHEQRDPTSWLSQCWVAREPVELRRQLRCQGSSNLIGASSLLRLHRAGRWLRDGDVCPQRKPSSARAAEGGEGEGAAEAIFPPRPRLEGRGAAPARANKLYTEHTYP